MKINYIIALVKKGYTAKEIKDVDNPEAVIALLDAGVEKENVAEYLELSNQLDNSTEENEGEERNDREEEIPDYEKMYNDLVKEQQKNNINDDMEEDVIDEKNDNEKIKNIVKEIF